MSKKNKKFKKKISQNLSQRIAEIKKEEIAAQPVPKTINPTQTTATVPDVTTDSDKYAYVKKDIRRDLLFVLVLVLILAAATVVNAKTGYFKEFADWIYRLLNLSV